MCLHELAVSDLLLPIDELSILPKLNLQFVDTINVSLTGKESIHHSYRSICNTARLDDAWLILH